MVGEVEVLVVDPDRVGQPPGHRAGSAAGSAARTRSGRRSAPPAARSRSPESPGSKISTVALCIGRRRRLRGQEGQVARPEPLAHLAALSSRGGPRVPVSDGLLSVGFWQRRRPTGAVPLLEGGFARCVVLHACRDPAVRPRTAPPRAATTSRRRPGRRAHRRPKTIEVTFDGDTVDPQRRARRRSTSASRSSSTSRPTRPARSTCTPTPSRSSSTTPAPRRSTIEPIDQPGIVDVESHTLERSSSSSKSAEVGPGGLDGIFAHGIGGAKDLPISPELAIAGAVAALAVSFTVLALAWREPRYDAATSGRPRPGVAGRARRRRAACAHRPAGRRHRCSSCTSPWRRCFGKDLLTNPFFGMFYVLVWVGLVPVVAALRPGLEGDQPGPHDQRRPSPGCPAATRTAASSTTPSGSATGPRRVGLFAFVWIELVYPHSHRARAGPAVVRGLRRGDAASAARCSATRSTSGPTRSRSTPPWSAKLSVWGRPATAGRCVVRSPLANLDTVPVAARPGRRWSRCCSAARRSTRSRTPRPGCSSPRPATCRRTCSTTWRCWRSASRSG